MRKSHHKPHRLRPKKPFFKKRAFWLLFLLSVLIAGGVYFFIFFKPLQVGRVVILGNKEVPTKELETLIFNNIKRKLCFGITLNGSQNIFLVNTVRINNMALGQYPIIDSLSIKKTLPNTLEVNIIERKPFAIFHNDEYFFIDEKGVAFKRTSADLPGLLIVRQIDKVEAKEIVLGTEVIKREIAEKIARIKKGLEEKSQVAIKEVNITSEERLDIKTEENWLAYFNLTTDINLQIEKLVLLLEEELPKESRAELQYIDLRFKDRVYYK